MQKNIFLKVEYLGSNYFGFQIQNKKSSKEKTVQEAIEKALSKLFRKKIRITYCSRTDRGVHAKDQGINFKIDSNIPLKNIKTALNSFLPSDIRIKSAKFVPFDFHSRFWSKSKIYRYLIFNSRAPSVFWNNFTWHKDLPLNLGMMKKASKEIIGKKDFSIFAKEAKKYKDCIREVKKISIKKKANFIHIDIEADGFLRNMARNIVSFLVRVGEEKLTFKDAKLIIRQKLAYHNKPAPACGLYLIKTNYEKS